MKIFIVYQIKNKVNNKLYIGQTSQSLNNRFAQHKYCQYPIGSAIRKYGDDKFEMKVLHTCSSREEANKIESELIQNLKTQNWQFGYNIELGGNAKNQTEETKKKISESYKAKIANDPNYLKTRLHSPENRAKVAESLRTKFQQDPTHINKLTSAGHTLEANAKRAKACSEYYKNNPHPKPMKGKHFSEESKEKMRQTLALTLARKKLLKLLSSRM